MTSIDWLPASLLAASPVRALVAGEALFRQGDASFGIFAVEHGRVQLLRHATEDRTVILHSAREGELFAEAALFSEIYHCDAIACVPTRVRILPKSPLLARLRSDPAIAERFTALLAHQVQTLRTKLQQRDIRSARERLRQRLLLDADTAGETTIAGSLKDLASEIGLTPEALYRALSSLEAEGAIERHGTRIRLRKGISA